MPFFVSAWRQLLCISAIRHFDLSTADHADDPLTCHRAPSAGAVLFACRSPGAGLKIDRSWSEASSD